jgi:hypothetical protein
MPIDNTIHENAHTTENYYIRRELANYNISLYYIGIVTEPHVRVRFLEPTAWSWILDS